MGSVPPIYTNTGSTSPPQQTFSSCAYSELALMGGLVEADNLLPHQPFQKTLFFFSKSYAVCVFSVQYHKLIFFRLILQSDAIIYQFYHSFTLSQTAVWCPYKGRITGMPRAITSSDTDKQVKLISMPVYMYIIHYQGSQDR